MSAQFSTPTDELLLLAETLGEVKSRTEKLETEFSTQARPLEAATNALSAALSGIKALQFHVLDNNLGALSARVEEMRKAVDEQVGVIALELKKANETNAAKAGAEAEALRSEIVALQSQLGSLVTQFGQQLERVEFAAKEEARKLQLIPGPAGVAGASLNPRGTFIDGETYNRLDVVSWLGSSYIATVDGVTDKPSKNSNQWQTLASRGGGGAGGVGDFGSLAGVAQINQGGTGQTTRAAALNALLPDQAGSTQYMLLTDGSGTVSWGAQPVAGLPSQTSNSGRLLTTNGTTASWSNAVTVSGSNATVGGTLTTNGQMNIPNGPLQMSNGREFQFQWGSSTLTLRDNTAGNNPFTANGSTSTFTIGYTTASTSTSSGALVVGNGTSGGLGVGGAAYIGGIIAQGSDGVTPGADPKFAIGVSNASTTGVLYWGSDIRGGLLRGYHDGGGTVQWQFGRYTASAFAEYLRLSGTTAANAVLTIYGTTASTSTSSGALVVGNGTSGGLGVGGAATIGGLVKGAQNTYSDTNVPTGLSAGFQVDVQNATTRDILTFGDGTRHGLIRGYHDGAGTINWRFGRYTASTFAEYVRIAGLAAADAVVSIFGTTASTGTSSGALVVSGGVGVAGAMFAGGDIHSVGSNASLTVWKDGTPTKAAQLMFSALGDDGVGIRVYNGTSWSTAVNVGPLGTLTANASSNAFRIATAQTPASASATGTAGTICWDTSYIYVCTATNTWKRTAISTW